MSGQDSHAAASVRQRHLDLVIQTPWPQQRRIDRIEAIGGPQDRDTATVLQTSGKISELYSCCSELFCYSLVAFCLGAYVVDSKVPDAARNTSPACSMVSLTRCVDAMD